MMLSLGACHCLIDSDDGLTGSLGSRHPVLRVPFGNPQGHLHHQRHRKRQRAVAQGDQDRGEHFPTNEAATKLIWLGLHDITANSGGTTHEWKETVSQFAVICWDGGSPAILVHEKHP